MAREPLRRVAVLFLAAALVSFHLRHPPTLRSGESEGASSLPATAATAAPAWVLPPGPASLQGRQFPISFVALGGKEYKEFLVNWAASVRDMKAPYVLAALDEPTLVMFKELGMPYIHIPAVNLATDTGTEAHYRNIRAAKGALVRLARRLLEQRAAQFLVLSDTDVAWLQNPVPYLERHLHADWFITTDCLSAEAEAKWEHAGLRARCGHLPGNSQSQAYNTGINVIRNRPASIDFLAAWEGLLSQEPAVTEQGWVIDDQLAVNVLFNKGPLPVREVEGALRTVWVANKTLKLHPLPVLHFANGHVAFVQRLPERYDVQPYLVHATFQPYGASGKRNRFREFGMWQMDPDSYYQGRFLTYDNGVRQYIQQYSRQYMAAEGREMVDMHKHLVGMAWQRATLRDALALGRMTNRTLVLPTLWCWCDLDQTPSVLENCTVDGSDTLLPFACPADFLVDPGAWDNADVAYRLPGFLRSPRLEAAVRESTSAVLRVSEGGQLDVAALAAQLGAGGAAGVGGGPPLVELRGMRPGAFGGFATAEENRSFDEWYDVFAKHTTWCCGGAHGFHPHSVFYIEHPRPLVEGWAQWQPPALVRPDWCEKVEEENVRWTKLGNHPCSFLKKEGAEKEG